MGVHWKGFAVAAATIACALALAACASSSGSVSAVSSSGSNPSGGADSNASANSVSSSSASAPTSGTAATISLDYNAGTGYEWTYEVDPEGIIDLVSQDTKSESSDASISGGPLQDQFTFHAINPGEVVLTFELVRNWEPDDPADTQVYAFTVTDDLQMILNPYKSDFDAEPVITS